MVINAIATILVAIIGLVGIIIQTRSHNKITTQEEILNTVDKKIDTFKKESKEDDEKLNKKLDAMELQSCKRFLIVEMTKISDGSYQPNEEQKRILYETKELYNSKGGDSYVDSMFESLQAKKIL